MYEFFIAFKYLLPKKKFLSTSLISVLSVFVISLVIWLIIVFISVTRGIEKNWIQKLTSINSHLRIVPTKNYYQSYYYQIDGFSEKSEFTYKTIQEKFLSKKSNPYNPKKDLSLPYYFPKKILQKEQLLDPVKEAFFVLDQNNLHYQDFEISGALMNLEVLEENFQKKNLSQISYLLSFPSNNPYLNRLILKPSSKKILSNLPYLSKDILWRFFKNIQIEKISLKNPLLPINAFSENESFEIFYTPKEFSLIPKKGYKKGKIFCKENRFFLNNQEIADSFIFVPLTFQASFSSEKPCIAKNLKFKIFQNYQNIKIQKEIFLDEMQILSFKENIDFSTQPQTEPLWIYKINKKMVLPKDGAVLPKNFKTEGIYVGSLGNFSYLSTDKEEIKQKILVSGFYDPGPLPIGKNCILVKKDLTTTLLTSSNTFTPSDISQNGISIWLPDIKKAEKTKKLLQKNFQKKGIADFWRIETYREYPLSKDLMQQFQSDRLLFTLVATIILLVACCNIISLLILLVNDKKKEIAVMRAMGASKKSIAAIFSLCGIIIGFISSFIGIIAAMITLKNLNLIVKFLSSVQGHSAFNPAFFGEKLPNNLNTEIFIFILIATPILSFIAGMIPAIKASKINPSETLKSL